MDVGEVANMLSVLESHATASSELLFRFKEQLEASRARVASMEARLEKREASVQTNKSISIEDQWNRDPGIVTHAASIVPERNYKEESRANLQKLEEELNKGVEIF